MHVAMQTGVDGQSVIVATKPPESVPDFDGRYVLHIYPRLYFPDEQLTRFKLGQGDITCTVSSPDISIAMPADARWFQPFPNPFHFTIGTPAHRHGFYHVFEGEPPERLQLYLEWDVLDTWKVFHYLVLNLKTTDKGRIFSMELPATMGLSGPISFHDMGQSLVSEERAARESFWCGYALYKDEATSETYHLMEHWVIDEMIDVPSVPPKDLLYTYLLSEVPFRDIPQTETLSCHNETHRANAAVTCESALFVRAVTLAREDRGEYASAEEHPAIRLLADWWNGAAPEESLRCAGFAHIAAHINDDGAYWPAYYETPESPMADYFDRQTNAIVGDRVILTFVKSRKASLETSSGYSESYLVNGDPYESCGIDLAEYDPAWYELEGLRAFPKRFPVAWTEIMAASKSNG